MTDGSVAAVVAARLCRLCSTEVLPSEQHDQELLRRIINISLTNDTKCYNVFPENF